MLLKKPLLSVIKKPKSRKICLSIDTKDLLGFIHKTYKKQNAKVHTKVKNKK